RVLRAVGIARNQPAGLRAKCRLHTYTNAGPWTLRRVKPHTDPITAIRDGIVEHPQPLLPFRPSSKRSLHQVESAVAVHIIAHQVVGIFRHRSTQQERDVDERAIAEVHKQHIVLPTAEGSLLRETATPGRVEVEFYYGIFGGTAYINVVQPELPLVVFHARHRF